MTKIKTNSIALYGENGICFALRCEKVNEIENNQIVHMFHVCQKYLLIKLSALNKSNEGKCSSFVGK